MSDFEEKKKLDLENKSTLYLSHNKKKLKNLTSSSDSTAGVSALQIVFLR